MNKLIINTTPIPKGRPRVSRYGTYTPPKTKAYQQMIAWEFKKALPTHEIIDRPLKLTVTAWFSVPKSYSKKKTESCLEIKYCVNNKDVDNLAKSVMDALNGLLYTDDKLVVHLDVVKYWGVDKVEIEWREL